MPPSGQRVASLDIIRGIAVMGILAANIPAFALPGAAYFSPMAWGGHGPGEIAVWLANFVLIEGKMRGLFSFLFGASMLLVIDRAAESGRDPLGVHAARMAVLFVFGVAHLYLVWWGDILSHYALVGMIAYAFHRLSARQLLAAGIVFLLLAIAWDSLGWMTLREAAPRDTPQAIDTWAAFQGMFGVPPPADLQSEIAAMRGPWLDGVHWRLEHSGDPFTILQFFGLETLSAMLLGMAGFRSGFLTGDWPRDAYRKIARIGLGVGLGGYLLLGMLTIRSGFDPRNVYFGALVGSAPFRVIAVAGYAALIILAVRPDGWVGQRLAAVGGAALTSYLGTSAVAGFLFDGWGLGLFGKFSRAEIYLVPPLFWLAMLAWSKPWLDRFHYGPMEWLWRSLSRLRPQPFRRR